MSSYESLQLNLLTFFEKGLLSDVTIVAQGKEILCHKVVLAAQSDWFARQFTSGAMHSTIELEHKHKIVLSLIRFMYFGGVQTQGLGPEDGLDMLLLSEELGIRALDQGDLLGTILPNLTVYNCLNVLQHEGLHKYPRLMAGVCQYVGDNFMNLHSTSRNSMLGIPRDQMAMILRATCQQVTTTSDAEQVVRFCLDHSQLESACDLLRETKQWHWGSDDPSMMQAASGQVSDQGIEWHIPNLQNAMEGTPARVVIGHYFDWTIRLDYGGEGKLRIVYESAVPRDGVSRCVNRFPASMFAWRVLFRGQDVFHEKPVFICFPENVSLHWSTTLPISAGELSPDDDIRIMVNMAENPMISLVLYYFSADLKTTVFKEDILNRLPHIEYRCLSSYSLVKTHGAP